MLHFIFNRYWHICLLQESPENTPYSITRFFMSGLVLVFILVFEWSFSYYNTADLGTNIILASGLLLSYFFYSYALLFLKNHVARLVQTVTALYYTRFSIGLSIWQLIIVAHIYKNALNVSAVQSAMAAIGLMAVNILTLSFLQ